MQTHRIPCLTTLLLPLLCLLLASGAAVPADAAGRYDANSWKTLIADDCRVYFDGCNNCRRGDGSTVAACTRKACAVYEKPRCLDQAATEGSMGAPFEGKLARFRCDVGNRFRVYHQEYVSGDQRVRLAEAEIMLADEQTRTAYRLTRERAASGAKYSNGSLEFREHGGKAMLS